MKRFFHVRLLVLFPFVMFAATQSANIKLTVVATDPLSYNVRPLPNSLNASLKDSNRLAQTTASASHQCSKTVFLNKIPYQITATKQAAASYCTIDHLGGPSYGIIMNDI